MVRALAMAGMFVLSCFVALPSVEAIQQNPICELAGLDGDARNDESIERGSDRDKGEWVFAGTYDPDPEREDYAGIQAWTGTVCSLIDGIVG